MMYLVTITNNERGETSAFITHDKEEAEKEVENLNKRTPKGHPSMYTAQAPIEITEIELR